MPLNYLPSSYIEPSCMHKAALKLHLESLSCDTGDQYSGFALKKRSSKL